MRSLIRSPLIRHPLLLARKIAEKAGRDSKLTWGTLPSERAAGYPVHLAPQLRKWADRCDLSSELYPANRIFGQDFEREELLDLCRRGPRDDASLCGDVKLPWEFSRSYAHVVNAIRTSEGDAKEVASRTAGELREWKSCNDVSSVTWQCAMEVAIRSVNWICTDALLDGKVSESFGRDEWYSLLWTSGHAIWDRLEVRLRRNSNHYIADLLGLAFISAIFPEEISARKWGLFAAREMPHVLSDQVRSDGGLYEASLPYHALVTEMVLLFVLISSEDGHGHPLRKRIEQMVQIVVDATDAEGDVFPVGDDDGGRVIPLDFVSSSKGRGETIRELASVVFGGSYTPSESVLYEDSGWWICRRGDFTILLEFGDVGMEGHGGHAHNDSLSFCLDYFGERIFSDPGSFLYTSNPDERNKYRATASHSTLKIGRKEQVPIPTQSIHDVFHLPERLRRCMIAEKSDNRIAASCSTAASAARARRTLELLPARVTIVDKVDRLCDGLVEWSFICAPGVSVELDGAALILRTRKGRALRMVSENNDVSLDVSSCGFATFYGTQTEVTRIHATCRATGALCQTWRLKPLEAARGGES